MSSWGRGRVRMQAEVNRAERVEAREAIKPSRKNITLSKTDDKDASYIVWLKFSGFRNTYTHQYSNPIYVQRIP